MKPCRQEPGRGSALVFPKCFAEAYPLMRRVAGAHAAATARALGLPNDEQKDLEQGALLEILRKLGTFDSSRASLKTFLERVVASYIASFLRRRRAAKRQAIGAELVADRVHPQLEAVHLRIDISRLLAKLPPRQRGIGLMLAYHSPVEVSRRTGMSRSKIYRTIGELRLVFIEAGLHKNKLGETA